MFFMGIHPEAVANPDLFSLAYQGLRVPGKEKNLSFQFLRQPEVIGIEEGDPFSLGYLKPPVAGRADPSIVLETINHPVLIGAKGLSRSVTGPVIDHNQLKINEGLFKD